MRQIIWLQTPTVFLIVGGNTFMSLNVHWVGNVRQTEIHTVEALVLEPSPSEDKMAVKKLKRYEQTSIDQIPLELI